MSTAADPVEKLKKSKVRSASADAAPPGVAAVPEAPLAPGIAPRVPPDDRAVFELLSTVAQQVGRADLVAEFKERAKRAAMKASAAPPLAPEAPVPALVGEGMRLIQEGKLEAAVEKLGEAVREHPEEHSSPGSLGVAYARLRRFPEAERSFREAIRIRPDAAGMYGNLGSSCLDQGKFEEAEVAFREGISRDPGRADLHRHLGNIHESRGRFAPAVDAYRDAVACDPDHADSRAKLGRLLTKAERLPEAEASFREAVRLRPDAAPHWKFLGSCLEAQAKSTEAEAAYRTALTIAPDDAEALNNLGVSLASQNRLPEAENCYRRALELAPKMALVHNNFGHNLRMQDRLEEAETSLKEAIRLQPDYAEARNNLGIVYIQSRRVDEGLASYEDALRIRPDYPEAHLNRALCWLSAGDLGRGWPEYEWRFKLRNREAPVPVPRWDGSPLNGRTLLLLSEQGLGDTAQFVRYAALVPRGSGGTIAMDCQEPLVELARTCPGIDRVIPRGRPLPAADVSCPLLSLVLLPERVAGLFAEIGRAIPSSLLAERSAGERTVCWKNGNRGTRGQLTGKGWKA